jgi:hypothetical protein
MAMNKKEQAAFDEAIDVALTFRALRWSPESRIEPDGGSQQGIALYSTAELALRAMRCEMEMRFAKTLANIDAQIAELRETEGE